MFQDELVVMSDKLILTLEDLVARLLPASTEKDWGYGSAITDPHDNVPTTDGFSTDSNSELQQAFATCNGMPPINLEDVHREKETHGQF